MRPGHVQAVVLLDGKQVSDFTFSNGVLRTTSPISWTTPTGETASVLLNLQFSAFSGEGFPAHLGFPAPGAGHNQVLGVTPGENQVTHGTLLRSGY